MKVLVPIFCSLFLFFTPIFAQSNLPGASEAGQKTVQGWTAVDLSGSVISSVPMPEKSATNPFEGSSVHPNAGVMSAPPPSITIATGTGPAGGYLPLSLFSIAPIAGVGDETITNFNVPTFRWAGQSWSKVAVASNGYLVVGVGSGVSSANSSLPSTGAPRNMLAPFWSNLNPTLGGSIRIGTLTDGTHSWIVVDWAGVRNAVSPDTNSFEIWMRYNDIEEVAYSYGHVTPGNSGLVTIGAQDTTGTVGATWSLNGVPGPPASTTELVVKSRFPIAATPNPLDFGKVNIFSSKLNNIVVNNPTHSPLKILSIALGGPSGSMFVIPPDTSAISPGGNKSFGVTCTPTSIGPKAALAIFTSTANNLPDSIPLSANSVAPPFISSVADLPMDQGGNVVVNWDRSLLDLGVSTTVTDYSVWRGIRQGAIPANGVVLDRGTYMKSFNALKNDRSVFMTTQRGGVQSPLSGNIYWQFLTDLPSHGLDHYSYASPTLADSTSHGIPWRYFFITANTADPNMYWDSDPDSGYSVDNIPPIPPAGLIASLQPGPHVQLSWDSPTDVDVKSYAVYRSLTNGFTPGPGNAIGTSLSTGFTDATPLAGVTAYYRIIAIDVHDNASQPSSVAGASTPVTQTYSIRDKWNMVSVPLTVSDYSKTALYPTAISSAFAFQGAYVVYTTLKNATGYWVKFNGVQSLPVAGLLRTSDTVDVSPGWNLIGSISSPVGITSITSIPGGMTTSKFFGYTGSYQIADTIQPGSGYWVKVTQSGKLVLSASSVASPAAAIRIVPNQEAPPVPPEADDLKPEPVPTAFGLAQNFPNPFNPVTTIRYDLPASVYVKLSIYNMLGEEVAILADGIQDAGFKSATFDAIGLPSGIYYYKLVAGSFTEIKKMILLK